MTKRILAILFTLAVLPVLPSGASQPSSGTVSPAAPKLTYSGAQTGVGAPADVSDPIDCFEGATCDTFELTVDVPKGYYKKNHRWLTASIRWADKANDLDLYLCEGTASSDPQCSEGPVASSEQSDTTIETITIRDPGAGAYRLIAKAFGGSSAYTGTVVLGPPTPPRRTSASGAFKWDARAIGPEHDFAEPSIDIDHSNVIYVTTNGGDGVQMWRSFDLGKTFDYKTIPAPNGGGDSEIEFLSNDIGLTADLEITDSAVSRSTDRFDTWTQQPVGSEMDRQWLAHRCSDLALLGYHDILLEAEMVTRSTDGGVTWDPTPVFVTNPGDAPGMAPQYADQGVNTFSGPLVVDQKTGDVYIVFAISTAEGNVVTGVPPFGEPEQIVVGTSHDEGLTWELHLIKSGEVGSLAGLLFPWVTLDKTGAVYVTWAGRDNETEPINVFLSYSNDHGNTFSEPYRVNTDATGHSHIYTTVSGGDPGVVDVAWYTSSTPDPGSDDNEWYVDFAQIRNANTSSPQISQSRVFPHSIHHGNICLQGILCGVPTQPDDRSLLDFFQIQIGPDGLANIAFANNSYPADATPDDPTDNTRPWYVRQTGGPSAGSGLHDSKYCASAAGGPGAYKRAAAAPAQVKHAKTTRSGALPGTGVGGAPIVAWVLLGAAVTLGARLRFARR